jgi:hypothetical protein
MVLKRVPKALFYITQKGSYQQFLGKSKVNSNIDLLIK